MHLTRFRKILDYLLYSNVVLFRQNRTDRLDALPGSHRIYELSADRQNGIVEQRPAPCSRCGLRYEEE